MVACNSGYEGSLTFSCNADFSWSLPQDTCGRLARPLSLAEQVGCPAATIDGIPVESAIFGETVEVPCPAGRHEGMMNVTCSATGVWETPATLCRRSAGRALRQSRSRAPRKRSRACSGRSPTRARPPRSAARSKTRSCAATSRASALSPASGVSPRKRATRAPLRASPIPSTR